MTQKKLADDRPTIVRSPDCGHSPKNRLLEDLAVARFTGDEKTLRALLSDSIVWTVIGEDAISGQDDVIAAVRKSLPARIRNLAILHVCQHGRIGAVNGQMILQSGQRIDFCDVCEFATAKGTSISAITSYVISSAS